jgi:hypothetical protein
MLVIHFPPAFQRAAQCQLVGKLQTRTGRQTVGNARQFQSGARQSLRQIKPGGVPFNVSAECYDNFFNGLGDQAFFQLRNSQIIRFNAIEWGDFSAKDVIFTTKRAGFFNAQDVNGLFDHAHHGPIAPRIGTNIAGRCLSQRAAICAELNSFARANDGIGQLFGVRSFRLDEMQCNALRRPRADARQTVQGGHERSDGFGKSHAFALGLTEAGQVKSRRDFSHLRRGNLLGLGQRLVGGGENHVLDQLRVGRIQGLRVDLD